MEDPKYEVQPLFSIPVLIGSLDVNDFTPILDDYRDDSNWRANIGEGRNNNWVSKDMNVLSKYPVQRDIIQRCVQDYVSEVMGYDTVETPLTTSWLTKTTEGGYAKTHSHTNAVVSGCFWFQSATDNQDGPICFQDWDRPTTMMLGYPKDRGILNSQEWWVRPLAGMIAIWPSYLRHRIGKSMSSRPRYSMAFNAFPSGTFGTLDSSITLDPGFRDA